VVCSQKRLRSRKEREKRERSGQETQTEKSQETGAETEQQSSPWTTHIGKREKGTGDSKNINEEKRVLGGGKERESYSEERNRTNDYCGGNS